MSKKRGVLVWCLFGLATILLLVSSLTVWAKRQLLDDQAWANSSTQLLANDEVRGAIAQKLSDALFQRVDVEAQLRERLPAQREGNAAAAPAARPPHTGALAGGARRAPGARPDHRRPRGRRQAPAPAEGADALGEPQQARPRRCREGAGGRGP